MRWSSSPVHAPRDRRRGLALIVLQDVLDIDVPPTRVWGWLSRLPDNYRAWHPAHLSCRFVRGSGLDVGAELVMEEMLHGRRHRLAVRATLVQPNHLLRYESRFYRGEFRLDRAPGGTRLTTTLEFGLSWPILGKVFDLVARLVLARRIRIIHAHMKEETRNLKRILEAVPNGRVRDD